MTRTGTIFLNRLAEDSRLDFLVEMRRRLPRSEWYLVGGAVRDALLGRTEGLRDLDLVVRYADPDDLAVQLGFLGRVDAVGRGFGVLKFRPFGLPEGWPSLDIACPRTERSGGSGAYRDFKVTADPGLPLEEDLSRRDFTVNALAWNLKRRRLVDPHGGRRDLEGGILRAVGEPRERFAEDLSRLLRAIRFACQLGFDVEKDTWEAVREMSDDLNRYVKTGRGDEMRAVPFETVAKEFVSALRADAPRAVTMLQESGLLAELMPELNRLVGCGQPPLFHSEGDVWTHTVLALQRAVSPEFSEFFGGEQPDVETLLSILLHDVGKPDTLERSNEGHVSFHGHDVVGAGIAEGLVRRLRLSSAPGVTVRPERVAWLVRWHIYPLLVDLEHVRRTRLAKVFLEEPVAGRQLLHLSYCDRLASVPADGQPSLDELSGLMRLLDELSDETVGDKRWLLTGEEVMDLLGLEPGPEVGRILDDLHEAQLSGEVYDRAGAEDFLRCKFG